jgi:uncharacterized membrane protein (UPF0127 family)
MAELSPHPRRAGSLRRGPLIVVVVATAVMLGVAATASAAVQWRRVSIARAVRCLPVAFSLADQERGLQGVKRVARPMVFAYPSPVTVWYWMKNTPVPLAGVWIGASHHVAGYWHGRPNSTQLHRSPVPVTAVIEYAAGAKLPRLTSRFSVGSRCRVQPGGL